MSKPRSNSTKQLTLLKNGIITPITFDPAQNIFSGGVYDQDGNLCQMAERSQLITKIRTANPSYIDPQVESLETIEGHSLYLGHYSQKYGRFLLETLARFWPMLTHHTYDQFIFHAEPDEYQIDPDFSPVKVCFDCFGIDISKVHIVQKPIRVSNLTVPSKLISINDQPHPGQAEVFKRISDYCSSIKKVPFNQNPSHKIYLSRKKLIAYLNYPRFAINEVLIEQVFAEHDFTIVHPEETEFDQLVNLINQAEVIAGIGGSSLHNTLFLQPGKTAISLGTPTEPSGPHLNQLICDKITQTHSVFFPFKGAVINELHGTFTFFIPHIRDQLKQWDSGINHPIDTQPPWLKQTKTKTVVAIVGLHRSCRSYLAKALHHAGLFSGDITRIIKEDHTEIWENEALVALNQTVLTSNKVTQGDDSDFAPTDSWDEKLITARDRNLEELTRQSATWMFNDSATLFTLPFWQDGIEQLHLAGTFAQPMSVALSLFQHTRLPIRQGFNLGCQYNQLLLETYQKHPFPLLCADLEPADFLNQVKEIINLINTNMGEGITLSADRGTRYFDDSSISFRNFRAVVSDTVSNKQRTGDALRITEAQEIYDELIAVSDSKTDIHSTASFIPLDSPVEAFQHALINDPQNTNFHVMLADALQLEGNLQAAANYYEKAVELDPDNPNLKIKLGELWADAGEIDQAISVFERLIESQYISVGIIVKVILLYRQQKDFERIIELCEKAFRMNPRNRVFHLTTLLAEAKKQLGDLKAALELYKRAADLDPTRDYIYLAMGDIYRQTGDFAAAAQNYQRLIEHQTTRIWPYIHLGHSLNQLGRYNECRMTLQQGLKIDPIHTHIFRIWGDSYRLDGDDNQAVAYYQKSISSDPNNIGSLINLGWALIRLGRNEEAFDIMTKAQVLQPTNPNIGRALAQLSNKP